MLSNNLSARRAAVAIALQRYGTLPPQEAEDRVGDALLLLVEGERSFIPRPRMDTEGYRVRYALGHVAGGLRRRAQVAKDKVQAEVCFTDLGEMGLERLEAPSRLAHEAIWLTASGEMLDTMSIVERIMSEHAARAAELLGMDVDDERLPLEIARQLDLIEERELAEPAWLYTPSESEPVVDPERILDCDVSAEEVNRASSGPVFWTDESLLPPRLDEDDWPQHREGNATRLVPQLAESRRAWSAELLAAWNQARVAWKWVCDPQPIIRWLKGGEAEFVVQEQETAAEALDDLREILLCLDEDCFVTQARSVARALAERSGSDGLGWKPDGGKTPAEELQEALEEFFGLEEEWLPPDLPPAAVLRREIEDWLANLKCWPSQRAGIEALLNGASPREARIVERRAFARSRG